MRLNTMCNVGKAVNESFLLRQARLNLETSKYIDCFTICPHLKNGASEAPT